MTLLDFTPARVDLTFWAGDDETFPLFLSTDAPDGGTFVGDWVATDTYTTNELVEHTAVFYKAVAGSTNIEPGTDVTKWVALTGLDLTGYTLWKAQIRSTDTDSASFTIDATQQASSIITLSITGTVLTARRTKGPQTWDLQVTDPDNKIRTLFAGKVIILEDATR